MPISRGIMWKLARTEPRDLKGLDRLRAKAALRVDEMIVQRGQQWAHYRGWDAPKDAPAPALTYVGFITYSSALTLI